MWAKAPLVLLDFPRLLLSLAFGALLLAVAVSAYPLFISAQSSHLVTAKIAKPTVTRYGAGVLYQVQMQRLPYRQPGENPSPAKLGQLFADRMSHPLLGPVISSVLGREVSASRIGAPNPIVSVRLFAGTGALDHVRVIAKSAGPGIWLADLSANALKVRPGDRISLVYQRKPPVEVRVAGIYRALVSQPRTGYWQAWASDIYPTCPTFPNCPLPTPFAIVDHHTLSRLFDKLGILSATYAWQAPLRTDGPLTLDQARSVATFAEQFEQDPTQQRALYLCCGSIYAGSYSLTARIYSAMPFVVPEVERDVAALEEPGRVLQAAGVLVALTVIAAAGAFALTARKVEAQLLFSRGTHPVTVAAKACLESVVPAGLGAGAGLGLAFLLVQTVRRGAAIGSSASREALTGAGFAVLASLALLGIVSAVAFLRSSEHHRARFAVFGTRVPWELALVALALYALRRLQTGGAFIQDAALHVRRPSVYLLLFPVLSIAGLATLGVRLFGAGLRWLRERSGRFASWLYLAIHRLAGGPRMTLLLVSASALCLGIFVQAQTIVRSLETTVDAKAELFVGSDVEGRVLYETPLPDSFPLPLARVTRRQDAGTFTGGSSFDLLAVDPSTLASAAYWNPGFSHLSIGQIARRLGGSASERVPIVVAGQTALSPTTIQIDGRDVAVRVVGHASAFPGMSSRQPLIVVAGDALLGRFADAPNPLNAPQASTEFWVKGKTAPASAALQRLKYPPYFVLTADQVKDIPEIAAVIETFLVLNALGLVAALLVIIGMLMYLQARQRSQVVSYGLSLRMGMSHAAHRRSLVVELGAMLCCSYAIGLLLSLGAALLLVPLLDPLATIPPSPLFVFPVVAIAVAFVAVLAASWMGGWLTNRRARAIDLGEIMRVAD